jgi:exopolysaccharide production protein ExoQ
MRWFDLMPFGNRLFIGGVMGIHLTPPVALVLTTAFIVFLFRRDIRERSNVSGALWLPLIWMLLIGSRTPTQWLSLSGFVHAASMEEGNTLDALVYFTLIAAGFYVLNKRQVSLSEICRNNGWLMAFLLYCFIAVLWSDFPFIAFKRWIKILGHPVMALIILTEPDPEEALSRLMKRSAYVLVPLSILFIKYYPDLGRGFDAWTGAAMNSGINANKNELGWTCMILGFFFFWYLLQILKTEKSKARRNELLLIAGFIYMIWWLLSKASSATSLLSLLTGVLTAVLLGLRLVNKRLIGTYALLVVVTLAVAELVFGIYGHVVDLTGHDATIAGRAQLWHELLTFHTNPIFGVGFESFWLGDRLKQLWAEHWWLPTEAHNGYLETYLNLGLVGLFLLIGLIVATFWKIRVGLLTHFQFGRFRLGFLAAVVVFNWTEASFKGLSLVWFVFYVIAMDYPRPQFEPCSELTDPGEEVEFTYHPDTIHNY